MRQIAIVTNHVDHIGISYLWSHSSNSKIFRDTRNHNLLKWTQLRSGTNAKGRVPNKDNTKIMGWDLFGSMWVLLD
ncbi:hypothetical protein MTR_2g069348 [Medicago truncatula]|uniref:Uncharacterized protein n=1 Tax=Medicago truncatula TaxID=3880 RepID=A0A072V8J6_MEDTR|nr:hypothetical protein MTR_2g069348 [Medicago truncatula]